MNMRSSGGDDQGQKRDHKELVAARVISAEGDYGCYS